MKTLTLLVSLLLTITLSGQSTDSLGIENNVTLNKQEVNFLNTALKNSRDTFDFTNKKIAFVTGSSGNKLISKQTYFLTHVRPWTDKGALPQIFFVRLTAKEKEKSNGYDAIVMVWVKLFTPKQKKRLIEQLSKNK